MQSIPNIVESQYGTIGGGFGNVVTGFDAYVGGGQDNLANGVGGYDYRWIYKYSGRFVLQHRWWGGKPSYG